VVGHAQNVVTKVFRSLDLVDQGRAGPEEPHAQPEAKILVHQQPPFKRNNYQERAASAKLRTRAVVTGDKPSAPGRGLRGLMPLTRAESSSWVPPLRTRLTGFFGCRPRSSGGISSMSVTT